MVQREELVHYLDQYLSSSDFQDYGPNGLQVEGKEKIKKIALSVSATKESIEKAVEWGADALLVHHGIFWKHQGARPVTKQQYGRIAPLIKNDLNLIAYHLPLDAHIESGNAAQLAKLLGLTNLQAFGEYRKMPLGVQGVLCQPMSVNSFEKVISKKLEMPIRVATSNPQLLFRSIGIITGGANNEWSQAYDLELDAYLTGEISEYNWHDAIEAGIHFFACGHHATERYGVQALGELLKDHFDLETEFFDSCNLA